MAQFRIQLFKVHPLSPRPFSNTYIVNAPDFPQAITAADIIEAFEKNMYDNSFLITLARISTVAIDGNTFTTVPYNENGSGSPSGTGLPLFNTLRVDIRTDDFGRQTQMHYRCLTEGVVVGNDIDGTFLSGRTAIVNGLIADLISNSTAATQADGGEWSEATSYPFVVQRSLHRKRRKPPTP